MISSLCLQSRAALSACSKQANWLVHQHHRSKATVITIHEASSLRTVVSRSWPHLLHIVLLEQLWTADNFDWPKDGSLELCAVLNVVCSNHSCTIFIVRPLLLMQHSSKQHRSELQFLNCSLIRASYCLLHLQWPQISRLAVRILSSSLDKTLINTVCLGLLSNYKPGLVHFDLSNNSFGPTATAELGQGEVEQRLQQIKVLNLRNTCLNTEAVKLVKVHLPFLEELHLDAHPLVDADGILLLSKAACWPRLSYLSLRGVNVTASEVEMLRNAYCGRIAV